MIYFYKGFGFLVVPLALVAMFIAGYLEVYSIGLVFLATTCFIADLLVKWHRRATCQEYSMIDKKTNREIIFLGKEIQNKKTGEIAVYDVKDTFFWLSLRVWSIIFIGLTVPCFLFLDLQQLLHS